MLTDSQLQRTEFFRSSHTIILKQDQEMGDLKNPKFWANIATKVRPLDQIYVFSNDGNEFAELTVIRCDRLWVHVGVVNQVTFEEKEVEDKEQDYSVKWMGPNGLYAVIRNDDGSKISEKHPTKDDANKSMNEYLKAIAH